MLGSRPGLLVAAASTIVLLAGCSADRAAPTTAGAGASGKVAIVDTGAKVTAPVDLVAVPGGKVVLVAQRAGQVTSFKVAGTKLTDPVDVLDLTERVGGTDGERGLLGLAVGPDGQHLYASYTRAADGASVVDEYRLGGSPTDPKVDPATRRELLVVEQPYANHNGGHIEFGPDKYLYLGLGDGGAAGDPQGRAQDLFEPLGKVLRLDPQHDVPADNPFVGRDDADARIWLRGVRNPWRFSFDPANGDLWIGDVGQDKVEEVDVLRAADGGGKGANLGWDLREGNVAFDAADPAEGGPGALTEPVYTYEHGEDGCSVTGGVVYRGTELPSLVGSYVFSDFCTGGVRTLDATSPEAATRLPGTDLSSVVGFGTGPTGELYVLSLEKGVYRLAAG